MKNTLKSLGLAGILTLAGCSENNSIENAIDSAQKSEQIPTISLEGRKSDGEEIDPKIISPSNNPYILDMDGDNVLDSSVMRDNVLDSSVMRNNVLYFAKGLGNGSYSAEAPILKINGNIIAYNIQVLSNNKRPSILFWDVNRKGYVQNCMGTDTSGKPFFGDMEEIK